MKEDEEKDQKEVKQEKTDATYAKKFGFRPSNFQIVENVQIDNEFDDHEKELAAARK